MIVLIASFVGVRDLPSLVMIFVLNAMMIMFGYLMEKINQYTEKTFGEHFQKLYEKTINYMRSR